MGKKMRLPFIHISKNLHPKPPSSSSSSSSSPPWPWPTCGNIRTHSFRMSNVKYNESYVISNTISSCSTMSDDEFGSDLVENIVRGVCSDRLFFEPQHSSALVQNDNNNNNNNNNNKSSTCYSNITKVEQEGEKCGIYEESEIISMHSKNPYGDFRRSMEEMVEGHGLKDWEQLEGLLGCYLKMNSKRNHGYIVGAFVDLLVSYSFTTKLTNSLSTTLTSTTTTSSSSSLSTHSIYSFPSSPLSLPSSSLTTPSILDNNYNYDYDNYNNSHYHVTS